MPTIWQEGYTKPFHNGILYTILNLVSPSPCIWEDTMQHALPYETTGLYLSCHPGVMGMITLNVKGQLPEEGPIALAYPAGHELSKDDFIFREDLELILVGVNSHGQEFRRCLKQRAMLWDDGCLVITPLMLG
jgi:hypothetical protein